jgi:hypothetical protein
VKPRQVRLLDYGLKAMACAVVGWSLLVVFVTIGAVSLAIIETWIQK